MSPSAPSPFPGDFSAHAPASAEDVRHLQVLYPAIPEAYLAFLRKHDGGEGWLESERYYRFWRARDLAMMNREYEVATHAPGLLLFGTDGFEEAFAFDTRFEPWLVGTVPFMGMSIDFFQPEGSFDAFLGEARTPMANAQ